jgi:amylo-alpha-1,6-glucosidase/glucodextranase-like protein
MKFLVLCICLPLLAHGQEQVKRRPFTMDELAIEVKGASREVAYTNKAAGVFYTETNATHRSAWQGWRVMSREIMEDYAIEVNGVPLLRSDIVRAMVYPHQLVREYANGVREKITMLDSVNALFLQFDRVPLGQIAVRPIFSDLHGPGDVTLKAHRGTLMIGRNDHLSTSPGARYPGWIALSVLPGSEFGLSIYEEKEFGRNYSPAALRSGLRSTIFSFVIAAGDSSAGAAATADAIFQQYGPDGPIAGRRSRIERVANSSYLRTDNPPLDKAICWAKVSLDALIMNQSKKGIFAGLPWFDDYWGRDSFISLPGATLVTGNFSNAKSILRSFAEWQDTLPASPTFGRIPNTVTTSSISYNSVDGTPRFVRALGEYVRYSGDTSFAREMYPVVKRSIEGTLKYHVDGNNFLTHGDAETWMDAAGSRGAWSPRGNRANDVQALWYDELREGAVLAGMMGPGQSDQRDADSWTRISDTLASNFNNLFLRPGGGALYDHLRSDGTPDLRMRPNQLFAVELIRDENLRREVFEHVTKELVYSHGVATLSQDDEDFHPYHHYPPYYVPDEAYHNGIVWPWLAGRWIDLAAAYGLSNTAYEVTENMTHQLLDRGAVGTLSELLDAAPRSGQSEPNLSGAYSQAWSLAEFIRSFYQSYLGVEIDAPRSTLTLRPRLPSAIGHADFDVAVGSSSVAVGYDREAGKFGITVSSRPGRGNLNIVVIPPVEFGTPRNDLSSGASAASDLLLRGVRTQLLSGDSIHLEIDKNGVIREDSHGAAHLPETDTAIVPDSHRFAGLRLATPLVRPGLKALRPPPYPLLTLADIKATNPSAVKLYDAPDPQGDDTGRSRYTYPQTQSLKPGSLDLTHVTVSSDQENLYVRLQFRDLSDPGWHPEYGFQLTYAAIAIDKDRKTGSGETKVGMNSHYLLKRDFGFEEIIYVGGGVRVDDSKGKILAEYIPAPGDESNPLGNISTKTIEFALPLKIVGTPQPLWRYAVLVGAQDDHGGAGIGEFRNVEAVAGEWVGGGKVKRDDPNVYDELLPPKSR